jgi:hypothetical protein
MTPSSAKVPLVDVRHATCANAVNVACAETSDATDAHAAAHVSSSEATRVASAKATHTEATAALGLCARCKKAAGKHCACQNHHHSSFHDILRLDGRIVPPQDLVRHRRAQQSRRQRRDTMEMRMLSCYLN